MYNIFKDNEIIASFFYLYFAVVRTLLKSSFFKCVGKLHMHAIVFINIGKYSTIQTHSNFNTFLQNNSIM